MKKPLFAFCLLLSCLLIIGCSSQPKDPQKVAIKTLVILMNAYNSNDAAQIKTMDLRTRKLPNDEIVKYFSQSKNFILKDVQDVKFESGKISGKMIYTTEVTKPGTVGKNINIAYTNFTLAQENKEWRLVDASPVEKEPGSSLKRMQQLVEMLDSAKQKFGVDDLSKLPDLNNK